MASKFAEYKSNGLSRSAVLEAYRKLKSKPKTSAELKELLKVNWSNLPQGPIDKAVYSSIKCKKNFYLQRHNFC